MQTPTPPTPPPSGWSRARPSRACSPSTPSRRRTADLDLEQDLPVTPWWPAGTKWSARRAILHIIAETSQHAGHADIVREAIDGQKTMG